MLLTPQQQEEIDQLRSNPQPTLRAVSAGMEKTPLQCATRSRPWICSSN